MVVKILLLNLLTISLELVNLLLKTGIVSLHGNKLGSGDHRRLAFFGTVYDSFNNLFGI